MELGGAHLGIGKGPSASAARFAVSVWLYVDDVDESYRREVDAGAVIEDPPADMPRGERMAGVFILHLGAHSSGG